MSSPPTKTPQYRHPSRRTRIPKVSPASDEQESRAKVQSSSPANDDLNASLAVKREARHPSTADLLRAEQTVKGWGKGGWRIIHVLSGLPITTSGSFVYENGAKCGYFRTKRAATEAIDALLESELDWSQGAEYFAGKRAIVQKIFARLFEAGS